VVRGGWAASGARGLALHGAGAGAAAGTVLRGCGWQQPAAAQRGGRGRVRWALSLPAAHEGLPAGWERGFHRRDAALPAEGAEQGSARERPGPLLTRKSGVQTGGARGGVI